MNKKILILTWLLIPVIAIIIHFKYGERLTERDQLRSLLIDAENQLKVNNYEAALSSYENALALAQNEDEEFIKNLALKQAQTRIKSGQLLEGIEQLDGLLMSNEKSKDSDFVNNVRSELAAANYHAGLLLRLEGASADEWKPHLEQSRQHYRFLAESSEKLPDTDSELDTQELKENLETVIRLKNMDLAALKGLALPKNCPGNCNNLSQRKRKQRENPKSQANKPQPKKKCKNQSSEIRKELMKEKSNGAELNSNEGSGS